MSWQKNVIDDSYFYMIQEPMGGVELFGFFDVDWGYKNEMLTV